MLIRRTPTPEQILKHISTGKPATLWFCVDGVTWTELVITHFWAGMPVEENCPGLTQMLGHAPGNPFNVVELYYDTENRSCALARQTPIVKLSNAILQEAIKAHVRRIKLVREDTAMQVLFERNDAWVEEMSIPNNLQLSVFMRMKLMAHIAEPCVKGLFQCTHAEAVFDAYVTSPMVDKPTLLIELSPEETPAAFAMKLG